ncbi:MAG: ABC transporter, permease protein 1 (cluster 5, nickel/peptides/opines) [uncultured Thermomicrobiales bacterium]|uniref:ABC transporter, permease protein 1 (Cluster 5, nickel/peptides/opines) n=1 Tax=uncultured Thermomicrobiales bacterium TaxID=1645740 RepID=A0A6J4VCM3_9BACT|nr:MAG: ABC transporter, permease protein 1 (cluster 5, nickel/peptides/opines) [uncultured Thermomicrobiales bacterium]
MAAYILRRLILVLPVILVVGVVVFALVHLTPGEPAAVILGDRATAEEIARLRDQLGLNDPLPVQFVRWFGGVLRLDFGESIFLGESVTRSLLGRVQPTVLLTLYALCFQILIGVPAGVLAAVRHNSPVDRVLTVLAISGASVPTFFLGILLILVFAVRLRWLPSGGYVPFTEDPIAHLKGMLLPAFALGFSAAGLLARLVRSSMLDVLREDYVRTAFAKGLPEGLVVVRHALRNALIPALTVIGTSVGALLGGAVVTETVFTIPGMGRLVVQSIARRDYPVIQGAIMTIAVTYVLVNLLVDLLYVYADPRVRLGGG